MIRKWILVSGIVLAFGGVAAFGWGADVHRNITRAAIGLLGDNAPEWLRDPNTIERVAFHANQPDRWRGWPSKTLTHENDPDHFVDAELLEQFGLTLETVPHLRNEYIRVMAVAKHVHPEQVGPYDAAKDPARAHEWPGFLLHAIAEHYAKLQAAFNQVRAIEKLNDSNRAMQLAEARAIAIYHLGTLSHFVGDAAQPLHTTKHYNGWVGENPKDYKWRDRFHAYIDEGWARTQHIGEKEMRAAATRDAKLNAADPWDDVLAYFQRSHGEVDRLYALETEQKLDGPDGRTLLLERLGDATTTLAALIQAAWTSSEPTSQQVEKWAFYDNDGQAPASQPTSRPAATP